MNYAGIHIAEGYNDPIPVWSPDGNTLAFIALTNLHEAYLYSVEDDEIKPMHKLVHLSAKGHRSPSHKLSWLPDGSAIAAFKVSCPQYGYQRCTFDSGVYAPVWTGP